MRGFKLRALTSKSRDSASGFTRLDLLMIVAFLGLAVLVQLPLMANSREGGHQAVCMNNLRQLSLAMLMYAEENQDVVPEEGNTILPISAAENAYAWYNLAVQPRYPRLLDLYQSANPPLPG